jgi:hypothetical protein
VSRSPETRPLAGFFVAERIFVQFAPYATHAAGSHQTGNKHSGLQIAPNPVDAPLFDLDTDFFHRAIHQRRFALDPQFEVPSFLAGQ